ncbi:MAG: flagellar export chaperone FliS [Planctomycetota bacterium]|nr:flagellar export chaperone FliS [Planctomycetota bacterium]
MSDPSKATPTPPGTEKPRRGRSVDVLAATADVQPQSSPENQAVTAYLRNRVLSASREELRLMLLDGAVRFASQAKEGISRKDYESWFVGLTSCRAIVVELLTSIREDADRDLAQKVKQLYQYMFNELVEVSVSKDPARLGKVIDMLQFERDTWALAMEQVAKERAMGTQAAGGAGTPSPNLAPASKPVGAPPASVSSPVPAGASVGSTGAVPGRRLLSVQA